MGRLPQGQTLNIFSDGCAGQFKQKFNFLHIEKLNSELEVNILWHFFASCHGKGAVDGIGGNLKMIARQQSLLGKLVTSSEEFIDVVKDRTITKLFLIQSGVIEARKKEVVESYSALKTIKGTQDLHCIWSTGPGTVGYKTTSNCQLEGIGRLY